MKSWVLHRFVGVLVMSAVCHAAIAQTFPSFPGMPKIPDVIKQLPVFPGGGTGGNTTTSGIGGWAMGVCALVGGGAAILGKKFAERDAKKMNLNARQARDRENSYMLGWGMLGCGLGGGVAKNVIDKMSADSKRAQDEAWQKAQTQTGPVSWQGPDARGTTEIVERERLPDGGECGTRRDIIEADEGKAEPMVRVCRTAGDTVYRPVTA